MLFVRKQHSIRNGHAQLLRQRIVEKLVVGAPPEGIVDNVSSAERRILQVAAIERDVVRDAIDDDVVRRGLSHADFANDSQFGLNARLAHGVDFFHQRGRERRLHAKDDSNFLHSGSYS